MSNERRFDYSIEDYASESLLQSAQNHLLVIEKNIINMKKNIVICIRENTNTKQRINICQNRIQFIVGDIVFLEKLKISIEAKIAEFTEFVEFLEGLPVVYDAQLELFIDQKIEYYTNYVARHQLLKQKQEMRKAYINRLQKILEHENAELVNHHAMVTKYDNWILELREKQFEMIVVISNCFSIKDDIVAFFEDDNFSHEIHHLLQGRYDLIYEVLQHTIVTLMQLNGFSNYIQNEWNKHTKAITDINDKIDCVKKDIHNAMDLLEETNIQLEIVEMKSTKVERQILTYINIQEEFTLLQKCRAYYELIATYEQEKENAEDILITFQEKDFSELLQLSLLESNLVNLEDERSEVEFYITSLI